MNQTNKLNKSLFESLTQKWWFYLILILIWMFIPIIVSKNFDYTQINQIVKEALMFGLVPYVIIQPILHIMIIVMVVGIFIFKNKFRRFFSIWVAINYFLVAFLQNIVMTITYGLVFLTQNLILMVIVGIFWVHEIKSCKMDYTLEKIPLWRYWVIPLAFLAFWFPVDRFTGMPDFNLSYLLYSDSALAFCMITPIYLAVISLFYPKINRPTIRVNSFIGIIFGLINIMNVFISPLNYWWITILHIPLLSISVYMFILSIKKEK
ncbi:MAG: hypothetical protein ACTSUG_07940 [Candidatus Helarchaeota archaeon]